MRIECVNNFTRAKQRQQVKFQGGMPLRSYTFLELMQNDYLVKLLDSQPRMSDEYVRGYYEFMKNIKEERAREYLESLSPRGRAAADKILALDSYENLIELSESFLYYKPKELEELYDLASQRDAKGTLRIPGYTIPFFLGIAPERLKILKPIMLARNEAGVWNYREQFIMDLENLQDWQIDIMSKLTDCNIDPESLLGNIKNKYINWDKTIEKAQSLKKLFGNKLRQVAFYSYNHKNFLSADIQLPHKEGTPDLMNFKRLFALLDDDVNPTARANSKAQIDNDVQSIYSKFEEKMHIFNIHDLISVINEVNQKLPEAEIQEIFTAMQKLTQFANYSCLKPLSEKLTQNGIGAIYRTGELNTIFDYFARFKRLFELSPDNLNNEAYLITKKELENPEFVKLLKEDKARNGKLSKLTYIYLEGWDDGVNLLTDDKKLAQATIKTLKKAYKILEKEPELTLEEAVSKALNHGVIAKMKEIGLDTRVINLDAPATQFQILDQLCPIMPSIGLVKSTIEAVAKHYTDNTTGRTFQELCSKIAAYYDENINAFSKQRIIEDLRAISQKINDYMVRNNLPKENLYFIIPETYDNPKSFNLINKMYKDLHNVPSNHIKWIYDIKSINNMTPNSTFVVLDDVVGSGSSMLETGEYLFNAKELSKRQHIIFAPITASKQGIERIKDSIKKYGRENIDTVLCLEENIKDHADTSKLFLNTGSNEKLEKYAQEVYGQGGHGNSGMCTVFPYMAPDNNSSLAGYLTKFFLPDYHCIKTRTNLLPVIEEETYYYDIFGTDKEHVLIDPGKIFGEEQTNPITQHIQQLLDYLTNGSKL